MTPAVAAEPVAWIVLSEHLDDYGNEKVRIWWRDKARADAWCAQHNATSIPLYASPPVRGNREAQETMAAGAIIDVMMGGKFDWRSRIDKSDFLESADWQQAVLYARAVLSLPVQSGAGERSQAVDVNIRRMDVLIETAQAENHWEREAAAEMRKAIATLAFAPFKRDDVERMVLAARAVAFGDDHGGEEGFRELDNASEAFAALIPWQDEPEDSRQAPHPSSETES